MTRVRPAFLVAALCVLMAVLVGGAAPATGSRSSDPFGPGRTYAGDFPDPWVLRVGDTYYAYATNTANLNLPTMTSKDLQTWTAYGDAFPRAGGWARTQGISGRSVSRTWAPSVTKVGDHFVLAYTAPLNRGGARKNCLGLADADSPKGPFRDPHGSPMVCPSDQGAIDPQVFVDQGKPYLLWKTEGRPGCCPTKFWTRELQADGTDFADGSDEHELLSTALSWEGNVIENPSLIRVNGLLYLFYSANEYVTDRYATGYAICTSVTGPCQRPSSTPLIASGAGVAGPGGPAPFLGPDGQLRLAYAAWNPGQIGYPRNQRRLHIARLAIDVDGLVHVTDRG
ncbi:MAG: putative Glycoside hydrolase, family 43 [Nocardioidaceae bacterium]|nr:putative Glycoside hydrolase, family 43 [Nocardioidaceae bacterium]